MTTKALEKAHQKVTTVRALLERQKHQISLALPAHMNADRFLRIAMTSLQKNPRLMECTEVSFLGAVMQSAQLGLELDGQLAEAHLIPYKNNKKGVYEAQFQPGYQGLLRLARNSEEIATVSARCVYERDTFHAQYGLDRDTLTHVPYEGDPGLVVQVYCIVRLRNGSPQFEWWSKDKIDRHRKNFARNSFNRDGTPKPDSVWTTNWEAMAKKTMIIQVLKYCPRSAELARAIALEELAVAGRPQDLAEGQEIIDVISMEEPISQLDALVKNEKSNGEKLESEMTAVKGKGIKEAEAQRIKENKEKAAEIKADGERKKKRKGLLSDDQLAEIEKARLAHNLSASFFAQILGNHSYEKKEEIKAADFDAIMEEIEQHGK